MIPVTVVTGFLGSGKTTLLRRLLARPELGETAVLVNELGEVAIDHHLLRQVDERTVLLASGCLCCALRGDLADELRDLLSRRERGEVPAFERVLIETSGLADPAPIVSTLLSEPLLRHRYALEAVVTTVDGAHGLHGVESEKQVAAADRLVVTKVDVADPEALQELRARLSRLNPAATVLEAAFGEIDPAALLGRAERALPAVAPEQPAHDGEIRALALVFDRPLEWTAFGVWLTMLLAARGREVLRVKGLLDVGGPGPVLLNGVQHAVHPPEHLEAWPDGDHRTRLVFIGRGLEREALAASLEAFDRAARR